MGDVTILPNASAEHRHEFLGQSGVLVVAKVPTTQDHEVATQIPAYFNPGVVTQQFTRNGKSWGFFVRREVDQQLLFVALETDFRETNMHFAFTDEHFHIHTKVPKIASQVTYSFLNVFAGKTESAQAALRVKTNFEALQAVVATTAELKVQVTSCLQHSVAVEFSPLLIGLLTVLEDRRIPGAEWPMNCWKDAAPAWRQMNHTCTYEKLYHFWVKTRSYVTPGAACSPVLQKHENFMSCARELERLLRAYNGRNSQPNSPTLVEWVEQMVAKRAEITGQQQGVNLAAEPSAKRVCAEKP